MDVDWNVREDVRFDYYTYASWCGGEHAAFTAAKHDLVEKGYGDSLLKLLLKNETFYKEEIGWEAVRPGRARFQVDHYSWQTTWCVRPRRSFIPGHIRRSKHGMSSNETQATSKPLGEKMLLRVMATPRRSLLLVNYPFLVGSTMPSNQWMHVVAEIDSQLHFTTLFSPNRLLLMRLAKVYL
jgi:hypothetical protein